MCLWMGRANKINAMSYVSLENSESFLKCVEVIAEDKSCIVSESVLYFSGKTGKGFMTVAGLATGIEVLAVNVSALAEDLVFNFLPSTDASSYLLSFDEIEIAGNGDSDLTLNSSAVPALFSSVSIADAASGRVVNYPKDRVVRSILVRVKKSSLDHLIQDFYAGTIGRILGTAGMGETLTW